MKAIVGDRLVVRGHAVGQQERHATIVEVRGEDGGPPFVVNWDDDPSDVPQDHLYFPGSDADVEHIAQSDRPVGSASTEPVISGRPLQAGEPAPVEVRIYRDGTVAHRQVCESADEAAALVQQWAEFGISRVDVDDLSAHHRTGQVLEPELEVDLPDTDEDYTHD